jgi:hypothetical protein
MAVTKHCLDAAPRVAAALLQRLAVVATNDEETAADPAAVQAMVAGIQEHAVAAPSLSWPQRFMEFAPQAWSLWIVRAVSLHSKAKLLLAAPRLFAVSVLHAAKNSALLTPAFSAALVSLFSAALTCADDAGFLSADDSSLLSSAMLPVLDNLFGDPMPSVLAAVVCGAAACMTPKSSLALLQGMMTVDRDAAVVATAHDHDAVWAVLLQLCSWTRRWPLADVLDLVQRTSLWLVQTAAVGTAGDDVHTLRLVIVEMIRRALSRPDIKGNAFTREAVVSPLVEAGLAEEFGL